MDKSTTLGRDEHLSPRETERYFQLLQMLREFTVLFDYQEASDRAIAIVGPAFLDTLMGEMLTNFFLDDEKEVQKLLQPDGPLGTYSAKVATCYCLGFIDEVVKNDLRLVGKIRNRFAHELLVDFADPQIAQWCWALRWHRVQNPLHGVPEEATARDVFQVGVNGLVSYLHGLVGVVRLKKRVRTKVSWPEAVGVQTKPNDGSVARY